MFKQSFTLTVTAEDQELEDVVRAALEDYDYFDFTLTADGPAEEVTIVPNRKRLIELAAWAAGEQAKKDLGLPSEWRQGAWLYQTGCGTACCIAGKVALDDGGVPAEGDARTYEQAQQKVAKVPRGWDWSRVLFPGSTEPVRVEDYAQEALGLTEYQAQRLFSASNSLADILRVVGELIAAVPADA